MKDVFKKIIETVEPIEDIIYGPRYRCALTLEDGTFLPCAILHSKTKLVDLAQKRFKEEQKGKGFLSPKKKAYREIISTFVASGNRVSDYDVTSAAISEYAIPLPLLAKIKGETTMAWTGWVFEMNDGKLFSYGTTFLMEFFQLPDGYTFQDVKEVHNHSYVNAEGTSCPLPIASEIPSDYNSIKVFRERVFFNCAIDGI